MIQAPKGTRDLYGEELRLWHLIEAAVRDITHAYGYAEIRTPMFEHTELFLRGVGDTSDIVQKEMYTFSDKSQRSLSLRPELTAGVARAYVQRGLHNQPQPTRLWYTGPNFRYEQPAAGRYRQHSQFGVEVFGAAGPQCEAEVISLGQVLLTRLGVTEVALHINSIGCPVCRPVYHAALKEFLAQRLGDLCGLCATRYDKNPLRVLDCKNPTCQQQITDAPHTLAHLCGDCHAHFTQLQELLTAFDIPFVVDPRVVRGLDYYTRTVFEFIPIGGGGTIIGGGRYDGLIEEVGGTPTPGVGFGMGIDRLANMLATREQPPLVGPALFVGHADESGAAHAQAVVYALRRAGIPAECDLLARSVKAQMKYANKIGARFTCVLGATELEQGVATLKDMQGSTPPVQVPLTDLVSHFGEVC